MKPKRSEAKRNLSTQSAKCVIETLTACHSSCEAIQLLPERRNTIQKSPSETQIKKHTIVANRKQRAQVVALA